jgi:hypothetical protein
MGLEAALTGFILVNCSAKAAAFHFIGAFTTILFVSNTQYVNHYGLSRKEISPGVYEPVGPQH